MTSDLGELLLVLAVAAPGLAAMAFGEWKAAKRRRRREAFEAMLDRSFRRAKGLDGSSTER